MICVERIVIIVPMILLIADTTYAPRPRRRFCEAYPYAPRCLGVAAKRSLQQYDTKNRQSTLDIYSTLIKRVLEETKRSADTRPLTRKNDDMDDEDLIMEKFAIITKKNPLQLPLSYYDSQDPWQTRLTEEEQRL